MRGSSAGLPDTFQGNGTTYYTLITVLDLLFSAIVVCPCVVAYWRSVWTLMDIYVVPQNKLISAAISTCLDKNRIVFYIVSRLYTISYAFVCVNGWRGPWDILTVHTQKDFKSLLVTTAVGLVALISMRALRNVSSPPCVIVNDTVKGYFEVLTMFRVTAVTEKVSLFILDSLFSVLVVGVLVVFVWRGLWIIVELLLFPEDKSASAKGSLILGYTIIAIIYVMQPIVRSVCSKLSGASRLLFADLFIIVSLVGTINVWRGLWMTLDLYFLPENLALSCWIALTTSLVLLILLGCANSLVVRGVFIDAEEPNEKLKKINKKMMTTENKPDKMENCTINNHVVSIAMINVHEHSNCKKENLELDVNVL
ncbi:hypothetical protein ABEB36_014930 [Hypothenemus hampei]|uniref:Uncharacterized protein n=1 Tax=Hypothenemus hampei TaxID=57062 RepID=A0ABD1E1K8_HYPHA